MKIKQEDGTEIEVFTEAEVQVKTKEAEAAAASAAVEKFKAENPDKTQELTDAQTKLAAAEKALKDAEDAALAGGNKDQIERLRKERDDAKEREATAITDISKKFDAFKAEIIGDTKGKLLERLSANDPELKKKIELEFDNYRPSDTTQKGIEERMAKAYQLATGNLPKPGLLDGTTSAVDRGDGGSFREGGDKKEFKPNEIAIGNVLGITNEQREKAVEFLAKRKANGV